METGEKQTNSCHLPRVLEEVPFTARNVTGSEVSQEAACGGRDAGSWAEDQRRRAGEGARAGRSAATITPGRGKEPRGRDVSQGWEGPTAQQDLHLSWATYSPLKDPADVLQRSLLWQRCGNNYRDLPLIRRETVMGKDKRVRSRYTENKEGPRKETKCQGGDQPQAEQPSETKWLTVKVRLSLPGLPRRPLMDRGWPRAPHCCCFKNADQKSTACPSLTSLSWGSTGPQAQFSAHRSP